MPLIAHPCHEPVTNNKIISTTSHDTINTFLIENNRIESQQFIDTMPTQNSLMTTKNYLNVKRRYFANLGIIPPPSNHASLSNISLISSSYPALVSTSPTIPASVPLRITEPIKITASASNASTPSGSPLSSHSLPNVDNDELDFQMEYSDEEDPQTPSRPIPISSSFVDEWESDSGEFVPPHLLVDHSNDFSVFQHRKKLSQRKRAY